MSEAILKGDQRAATDEKCFLEDEQRKNARERKARMLEWTPNLFERNLLTGDWVYKFAEFVVGCRMVWFIVVGCRVVWFIVVGCRVVWFIVVGCSVVWFIVVRCSAV